MNECKIVADLLPTYCDGLTGQETNDFLQAHLDSCPGCRKLLEQMQRSKEQERADIRRAEFRAALDGYQRRHKMRVLMVLLACALLIGAFFGVRACSFELAIARSGLNRRGLTVVQEPTTGPEGKVFQVVLSGTKKEDCVLAYLEKDLLGFWTVKRLATPDTRYGVARIGWSEALFSIYWGEAGITAVIHEIYAGHNAVDVLEKLPEEAIPPNVAVMITQNSSEYYIHMVTVLTEEGTTWDILSALRENGLIADP